MKYNVSIRKKIYDFNEYLIAFVLILNCRSIWTSLLSTRSEATKVSFLLLVCATFMCILTVKETKIYRFKKGITLAICFLIYMLLFLFLNTYNHEDLIINIIVVFILILYYSICNANKNLPNILLKYEKLVLLIAILSMFFWIFGSQLHIINPSNIVYSNWSGTGLDTPIKSYYGIYFETQGIIFDSVGLISRNSAVFVEAPMCSLHFSIALLIELFLVKKISKVKVLILILANITTFSSTGVILIVISLGTKFIINNPKSKVLYIIKVLFIPLCILFISGISYILLIDKLGTNSGSIRIDDFKVGFKAWKENIFFGAGFNNYEFIKSFMESWRSYNTGFSNSPMIILSDGGIYIGLLYICSFALGIIKSFKRNEINKVTFIAMIIYLFTITIFPYQYLLYFMLIYFFDSIFGDYIEEIVSKNPENIVNI